MRNTLSHLRELWNFAINILFTWGNIACYESPYFPNENWCEHGVLFMDAGILLVLSWGCIQHVLLPPAQLVFILCFPSCLHQCVQLQRLKRSLSFKTMMRSKSVENFFQRSYSDARLPADFITDPPPPSPPLPPGSPLIGERSPSISPSLSPNPSICSHSPSLSLSPSLPAKPPRAQINHCFQDHIFRKPTNCQHCKHMIVGKVLNLFPQDYTIPCRYIWLRLMTIGGGDVGMYAQQNT